MREQLKNLPRTETLLVLACAASAAMLAGSQFVDIFHLIPPGGEALQAIDSKDQHGWAMLVLAVSALVMLVLSIATRGKPIAQVASAAVAVCGIVALLIFLIGDLPDVNKEGTLNDDSFINAEAEPQAGFWLEMVGSVLLAACGIALATLSPEQLRKNSREEKSKKKARARSRAKALTGSRGSK